jgi:hypothetical protein
MMDPSAGRKVATTGFQHWRQTSWVTMWR